MMDARLVWDTWRKVLTSDELVDWALQGSKSEPPGGLSAAERIVLEDYAGTAEATATNLGMYRRGLTRNTKGALCLTPVTSRLLHASELDVDLTAEEFARHDGYRDHGPNMWGLAEEFIDYLSRMPQFASPMHRDAIEIDKATAGLARRLGSAAVAIWPEDLVRNFPARMNGLFPEGMRLLSHPAATVISSAYDLTPWLENPDEFDVEEELERSPRHWLIYFPAADADVEYAELSERSALIFRELCTSRTVIELAQALDGMSSSELHDAVTALIELGAAASEDALATGRWPV